MYDALFEGSVGFHGLLDGDVAGFVVGEVFVGEDFVEYAVGVPGGAGADEFAVGCAQGVEDCIVEFLVVGYKVEFISIDHVEGWSTDGFRVVGEGFDGAAVSEMDLGALGCESQSRGKLAGEGSYAAEDAFGLAVGWADDADGAVCVGGCVPEQKGGDYEAFAALPTPPRRRKLIINKQFDELFLVGIGPESQDFSAKVNWVSTERLGFLQRHLFS